MNKKHRTIDYRIGVKDDALIPLTACASIRPGLTVFEFWHDPSNTERLVKTLAVIF